jgi:succinoglycan biosynthesis protein ExoA
MKKITLIVPLAPSSPADILKSVKSKDIVVVVERGLNPSANRNKGIRAAKTPFVAFANGHTLLADDWKEKTLAFFKKYPHVDVVGGPELNSSEDNFFGRISGYALSSPFGSGGIWKRYGGKNLNLNATETDLTSANLICKKHVFKKVMFDESLYPGEDPKFVADLKEAGFKVAYSPDIKVSNKRREDIGALMKQVFRYGKVRPQKESFSHTLRKPFFLIPAVFLLYVLSLLFFNAFWYTLPALVYLVLLVAFTVYLSLAHRDGLGLLILPAIFPAIHLSYGAGMIYGLLIKRKK